MKKLLVVILCCLYSVPASAALAATEVWEVRQAGSNTNGGAFNSAAGGTDMSQFNNSNATACTSCQSATVNISTTDAVTAGTTTITSATANFSSAITGNVVYITGGTGSITAARYEATFVNSTTITVDRSTGLSAGTGATLNIGGALAFPDAPASAVVAGNIVYVRADSTYLITAAMTAYSVAGTNTANIIVQGYTSSRTDNGSATVQISSGTGITIFTSSGAFNIIRNLVLDCNTKGTSSGLTAQGGLSEIQNLEIKNCTTRGILVNGHGVIFSRLQLHGMTSAATAAFNNGSGFRTTLRYSRIYSNATLGITTAATGLYYDNVIDDSTGVNSDCFQVTGTGSSTTPLAIVNNTISTCGRDAIRFTAAASADGAQIRNNIFASATGIGENSATTTYTNLDTNYNCFYNNGTVRAGVPTGANDATASGDPFTSSAGGDFSLNNTASAGAAFRGAGFPGALPSGGTGALSCGALTPSASGSSSVTVGYPLSQ